MLQLVERGFFKSTEIKLSQHGTGMPGGAMPDVQILRVGSFDHPKYGQFAITPDTLRQLKENFDKKVRGVELAVDYFHKSDEEAAGWFQQLYLTEDGNELWAKVNWTKTALTKLAEQEIRYFSPDFAFIWKDPESGIEYKNVLFGGGLTNRPFVKDMAAIEAAEQEREQMKLDELEKKVLKLSDDHDALKSAHDALKTENEGLKKKLAEYSAATPPPPAAASDDDDDDDEDDDSPEALKKKLADVDGRNKELEKQLADMKSKAQLAEKTAEFNVLLSEGKACAAQKDAYIKGDMAAFVKLAGKVNLSESGHEGGTGGAAGDKEDRILKLAEEKVAANPKLSKIDAITLAQREIKE